MFAALESETVAGTEPAPAGLRTIKLGLLGLGRVGQAVARLGPQAARLRHAGYRVSIAGALVRDIDKPRRCLKPSRITTNPSAFLRGNYDVVVEALGDVALAYSIVRRVLGRGTPVVTANKALVAAHGPHLAALAASRGTTLRYEASALAGVPFLGALAARPLVSDVEQFVAVVNGTSNFILSRMDTDRGGFAAALARAEALGLTEPDSARDLDGIDAADKLVLLATIFGWGALPASRLQVRGIREITSEDLAVARSLDCTIKAIVSASRGPSGVSAFIGPALTPLRHPLAGLQGTLSGIHLSGRFVSDLCFSGPGAGPDVTAATMLDDVVEAVATTPKATTVGSRLPRAASLAAPPVTPWFVRARFPGLVPSSFATTAIFASHNLTTTRVTDARGDTRWVCLAPATSDLVARALADVEATHRIRCLAMRSL
jgi:homoserine dehydrogenase